MTLLYDDDFVFFSSSGGEGNSSSRQIACLSAVCLISLLLFLFVGLVLWRSGFFSERRDSLHPQRCALPGGVIFTPSLSFFFTFYLYKGRQAASVLLTLALASTNAI